MITIDIPMRPWTANRQRVMHHMDVAKLVKLWREAAAKACEGAGSLQTPVLVDVRLFLKGKRSMDCGACYPAVKAAIDGMVDAGVIPDDTPFFLAGILMHAPVLGATHDHMEIRVHGA